MLEEYLLLSSLEAQISLIFLVLSDPENHGVEIFKLLLDLKY